VVKEATLVKSQIVLQARKTKVTTLRGFLPSAPFLKQLAAPLDASALGSACWSRDGTSVKLP
jgi:hypothetical protein